METDFSFATFCHFEMISKENVKIIPQTSKRKEQKHLMADGRGEADEEAKREAYSERTEVPRTGCVCVSART